MGGIVDNSLRDLEREGDMRVVAIPGDGETLLPRGNTRLQAVVRLTEVGPSEAIRAHRRLFARASAALATHLRPACIMSAAGTP